MDVAKVGARTRAESSGQSKRRKVGGEDLAFSSLSSTHEHDEFCKFPQASISLGVATGVVHESHSSNFSSDNGASCCSSEGSAEAATNKLNFPDLEGSVAIEALSGTEYIISRSRETTLSNQQEPTSDTSYICQITVQNTMPLEAELEEFFAVAEKNFRKQFTDKYNYDISKDEPLGGRYEWVPLKP